eukprot:2369108-Rhodomonas_salina.2
MATNPGTRSLSNFTIPPTPSPATLSSRLLFLYFSRSLSPAPIPHFLHLSHRWYLRSSDPRFLTFFLHPCTAPEASLPLSARSLSCSLTHSLDRWRRAIPPPIPRQKDPHLDYPIALQNPLIPTMSPALPQTHP